jgi:hypothetical protein
MTPTVTRQGCGTFLALLLHLDLREFPCPECMEAGQRRGLPADEVVRRLAARPVFRPVTPGQAWRNRQAIVEELKALGASRRSAGKAA